MDTAADPEQAPGLVSGLLWPGSQQPAVPPLGFRAPARPLGLNHQDQFQPTEWPSGTGPWAPASAAEPGARLAVESVVTPAGHFRAGFLPRTTFLITLERDLKNPGSLYIRSHKTIGPSPSPGLPASQSRLLRKQGLRRRPPTGLPTTRGEAKSTALVRRSRRAKGQATRPGGRGEVRRGPGARGPSGRGRRSGRQVPLPAAGASVYLPAGPEVT